MFCEHCGKQVEDNAAFCEHCGAKFENAPQPVAEAPAAAPVEATAAAPATPKALPAFLTKLKEKAVAIHKKNKFILPGCGTGLAAIIVGIILLVNFLNQVPIKNFVKVEATGYEGFSEFVCDLDEQSIIYRALGFEDCEEYGDHKYIDDDVAQKAYKKVSGKDQKKAFEELYKSLKIEYKLPEGKSENTLCNGDEIEVIVSCDEDAAKTLDFPLKSSTFTYKVSGLKSVDLLNVFSYFDIEYFGADGYASARMVCNKTEEVKKGDYTFIFTEGERYFTIDSKNGSDQDIYLYVQNGDGDSLSNDDEITVTMSYIDNDVYLEKGFAVGPVEKTFKVSGLTVPQEIDLLQYYIPKLNGINGNAYVSGYLPSQEELVIGNLRIDLVDHDLYYKDQYMTYFYFETDIDDDISNGDQITITIDYNEENFARCGITLAAESKTWTAEGAFEWVDELSDLAPIMDDLVASAKEKLLEELDDDWSYIVHDSYFGSYSDKTKTDPVLYKTILCDSSKSYYENHLWFVFSSTVSDSTITTPTTMYFAVKDDDVAYSTTRKELYYKAYYSVYSGYTNYAELEADIGNWGEMEIQ